MPACCNRTCSGTSGGPKCTTVTTLLQVMFNAAAQLPPGG